MSVSTQNTCWDCFQTCTHVVIIIAIVITILGLMVCRYRSLLGSGEKPSVRGRGGFISCCPGFGFRLVGANTTQNAIHTYIHRNIHTYMRSVYIQRGTGESGCARVGSGGFFFSLSLLGCYRSVFFFFVLEEVTTAKSDNDGPNDTYLLTYHMRA